MKKYFFFFPMFMDMTNECKFFFIFFLFTFWLFLNMDIPFVVLYPLSRLYLRIGEIYIDYIYIILKI